MQIIFLINGGINDKYILYWQFKILAANAIELTGINTYYIGGSPCSGKSTVAEIISEKYNLYYFKVDDFLEKYTKMGAAYLPKLMKNSGVLENRYIAITPREDFQIEHYRQREWVPFVLEGCSDKDRAFSNWMKRDILFAKEVQKNCDNERFYSIINNGSVNVDELVAMVVKHFGLGE